MTKIRQTLAATALVAIAEAAPATANAEPACTAGPLSAYLNSAGLGCRNGRLAFSRFAGSGMTSFADQIWVVPFVLQGPPGFNWVGFSLRFNQANMPGEPGVGFSFWSEGAALFGLLAQNDLVPQGQLYTIRGWLTGDGGQQFAEDRQWPVRGVVRRLVSGCHVGVGCVKGASAWTAPHSLRDADRRYDVATRQLWGNTRPSDYTVAVLTSSATPEPATLVLLGTGLAGLGGAVRRRRRR